MVLRHYDDRVSESREDFQAPARDPELPLHGLVGIGHPAHREHLRLPPRRGQLSAQELGRVLLDEHLALEIQPGREAEVLVRGTGVAVRAAMRASPVRVDAGVEADVGAVVGGDYGAGVVAQVDGLGSWYVRGLGGGPRPLRGFGT